MYSKSGSINNASHVFKKLPERDVVAWNAIIARYGQHKHGKNALQPFEQMQQVGLKPDHITFVGVLVACSNVSLGDEARQYFQDHCITPRANHYGYMIDLFGQARNLEEAENFVKNMSFETFTGREFSRKAGKFEKTGGCSHYHVDFNELDFFTL
eukprot:Gb_13025 [translate_table: standard]